MIQRHSIDELRDAGVVIDPREAIAIVQELIRTLASGADSLEPSGPLSTSTLFLSGNGTVSYAASGAGWGVQDVASLLRDLLPEGRGAGSGGLLYTLARALRDIDAPGFDSLAEFSTALAPHERGARADAIRAIVERAGLPIERRQSDPSVAVLRRELRDADVRLYGQQHTIDALAAQAAMLRNRRRGWIAATVIAIVSGSGAAWLTHRSHSGDEDSASRPVVQSVAQQPATAIEPVPIEGVAPGTQTPRKGDAFTPARVRRAAGKNPSASLASRQHTQRRSPFSWLRSKIVFRIDDLK